MANDFSITPWRVEGTVDYDVFLKNSGISKIDEPLKTRIAKYTGASHFMIRRDIYYAHRDFNWLLDQYEKGNPFYIFTGRGPSGGMTIGHLMPFVLAQWLQEKFGVEVYIQMSDEEKYLSKKEQDITLQDIHKIGYENMLDIVSLGFKRSKTKVFFDTDNAKTLYKNAVRIAKHITFSTVKDAFGFGNDTNIGLIFYTSMQAAPAFLKSVEENKNVPCLVPLAIDQDVHLRLARDVAPKLGYYKPALIHSKFLPGLDGSSKMSSSDKNNTIYLTDNEEEVRAKVGRAFTGQQATAELQRKYGGNPDKCVVCQYYKYFFEPNDKKLEEIFESERNGSILAGEHKKHLADTINAFLKKHRQKKEIYRKKIDDYIVRD